MTVGERKVGIYKRRALWLFCEIRHTCTESAFSDISHGPEIPSHFGRTFCIDMDL